MNPPSLPVLGEQALSQSNETILKAFSTPLMALAPKPQTLVHDLTFPSTHFNANFQGSEYLSFQAKAPFFPSF
jgi:hypothetical protein